MDSKRAWVTLLTRSSYLPGAVLLAHSLQNHKSRYPLLILTTPSLPSSVLPALDRECSLANATRLAVAPLHPPASNAPATLIAARFADTWTKLRCFELCGQGYARLVFLDADMLVRRNMDELFELGLPRGGIAANHACVCNLDGDAWAPPDWTPANCAYTGVRPGAGPAPVRADVRTHTLLNSGMFVFEPRAEQWAAMLAFLAEDPVVKSFLFPDQDFLAEFFRGRWRSVGWEYNALKTMRYWHGDMWRDDSEVRNLHYIVDKPWSRRVGADGVAGYLGRDGVTHKWWWEEYEAWESSRRLAGEEEIVRVVAENVAPPLGEDGKSVGIHGNWQDTGSKSQ